MAQSLHKLQILLLIMLSAEVMSDGTETSDGGTTVHNYFYLSKDIPLAQVQNAACPTQQRPLQGPPGKRGPKGERGLTGAPGKPGIALLETVENQLTEMKGEIAEIKMEAESSPGATLVGHDSEGDFYVHGCEPAGCYARNIAYKLSMDEITALITKSRFCRQFLRYHCRNSILFRNHNYGNDRRAWWISRSGERINRWAGASTNYTCPCRDLGTCVLKHTCNCDKNDGVWRTDEGYITDKNLLPVTQLRFGDIGGTNEEGFHTLGKLECFL